MAVFRIRVLSEKGEVSFEANVKYVRNSFLQFRLVV